MPDNDFGDPFASKTVKVGHHGPVKWAIYDDESSPASADLVAAVTNKKIRVLALVQQCTIAVGGTWKLQTGAATDITPVYLTAVVNQSQQIWPYNPMGWCETVSGAKLNLVLANQTAFKLHILYEEVEP